MLQCGAEDFLAPPAVIAGKDVKLFSGLIRVENDYVPVLDVDSLFMMLGHDTLTEMTESKMDVTMPFAGKRVLLAEDSRVVRKKMETLFSRLGFLVTSAADGRQALELASAPGAEFDLIFSDIEMPYMDGVALVRALRRMPQYASTPMLFNSALSNPALIADVEKEGLGQYIVKFDRDNFMQKLYQLFPPVRAA
jgi:CheY-like chemotaxis protein